MISIPLSEAIFEKNLIIPTSLKNSKEYITPHAISLLNPLSNSLNL